MADLNKVILIGRLTRDPEIKTFNNGGKVAKMSLAVGNRKKNNQTGQWEDDPMYIDVEVYNRGESRTVDLIEERLVKGSQVCFEGKLILDKWDDRNTGEKRSKHKIVADSVIFLEPRRDGGMGGASGGDTEFGAPAAPPARSGGGRSSGPRSSGGNSRPTPTFADDDANRGNDDDIPF
ncbi:single-stranded DNA-binding protein [Tuwongella immobilis]|uniref:Single-stranded DNA-binding protein n=1 Tax=Tuwongella immobilis TaxID=692036 RepID=A0A6C2YT45_9BACT|nr:single-stranded DNA-binding protein [Tuwongella immobilis]VIP04908.1 single-stranded dna-binding protein : Single-stranded DNA-binding protein OS=Coraliomargarita sp. CAG:312 GN=BN601_01296 PE=4 SV=1: SSB [Tuwongella immobilis]VTS07175.1 single-stranded dna-binding protein : Single-stranded DNA-binding protein OS=Coraliomargarita sp. CAG:312 GN=BN601_01296 PE=4 SV=1: SSB [Tuwongella immobilis]